MINRIGNIQPNTYKPGFSGKKDIVIIDDTIIHLKSAKRGVNFNLYDKKDEYTIHTALGGDEGVEKVKRYDPLFVMTAYNMPTSLGAAHENLIRKLKALNTKVIVNSSNWSCADLKDGVKKCEEECGADKFIDDIVSSEDTIQAIINGKEIPRYDFQKKSDNKEQKND